jgi:hypothetical protein
MNLEQFGTFFSKQLTYLVTLAKAVTKADAKIDAKADVKADVANSSIQLKEFVDLDLDALGWYALGHHDAEAFFAKVAKRDVATPFQVQNVEQGWAKFTGNHFEFAIQPSPGYQPITILASMTQSTH